MVWRLIGWIMVVFLVVSTTLIAGAAFLGVLFPIDVNWSAVPVHAIIPIWISYIWYCGFVLAAIPAPMGFFRRARRAPARVPLLIYALATFTMAMVSMAAIIYLARFPLIPLSTIGTRIYSLGDIVPVLIISSIQCAPAVAALIALRREPQARGFEIKPAAA